MAIDSDDRVRLTKEEDGVPAGTEGIVRAYKTDTGKWAVQFGGYGWHEASEESLEAVETENE